MGILTQRPFDFDFDFDRQSTRSSDFRLPTFSFLVIVILCLVCVQLVYRKNTSRRGLQLKRHNKMATWFFISSICIASTQARHTSAHSNMCTTSMTTRRLLLKKNDAPRTSPGPDRARPALHRIHGTVIFLPSPITRPLFPPPRNRKKRKGDRHVCRFKWVSTARPQRMREERQGPPPSYYVHSQHARTSRLLVPFL